ncbi:uncharacterized protein BYT42DRAFT_612523 [Radiomyces spectabilis]|uniref:uncharacterized protein n=1 Tax=Radiomyces spectabilis TaxID=64574 RepID=UPI00221FBF44|nr:uncharacterized protein BYT42DRAFT_612523 [Radiomyces spectabilis]KAI8384853.1 hypothetical protein BYT42DRAFT_612523 [Radiomyces spectabilis]
MSHIKHRHSLLATTTATTSLMHHQNRPTVTHPPTYNGSVTDMPPVELVPTSTLGPFTITLIVLVVLVTCGILHCSRMWRQVNDVRNKELLSRLKRKEEGSTDHDAPSEKDWCTLSEEDSCMYPARTINRSQHSSTLTLSTYSELSSISTVTTHPDDLLRLNNYWLYPYVHGLSRMPPFPELPPSIYHQRNPYYPSPLHIYPIPSMPPIHRCSQTAQKQHPARLLHYHPYERNSLTYHR